VTAVIYNFANTRFSILVSGFRIIAIFCKVISEILLLGRHADLYETSEIVPAGILELINLHQEGFAYVKP
jgi:hypothetical protein